MGGGGDNVLVAKSHGFSGKYDLNILWTLGYTIFTRINHFNKSCQFILFFCDCALASLLVFILDLSGMAHCIFWSFRFSVCTSIYVKTRIAFKKFWLFVFISLFVLRLGVGKM